MKGNFKKWIVPCFLIITMVLLTGCGGPDEKEVTPQKFVFGYDEARTVAATRVEKEKVSRVLPAGTMFPVRILQRVSSYDAHVGDVFRLEVIQDVIVDGAVVIPVGSMGQGRVTIAKRSGLAGNSGDIAIRFDFVNTYDGVVVPIEWEEHAQSQNTGVTYTDYFIWGDAAFLKKGQDIAIPADSQFYVLTKAPTNMLGRIY